MNIYIYIYLFWICNFVNKKIIINRYFNSKPLENLPSSKNKILGVTDVLVGQLAEATKRPIEVSAWTGTLAETLAAMAQTRCWRPPSRWRSFRLCHRPRPGQIPPKVETTPRVLLLPLSMSESAGTVRL
jgi:hypothetical protein